MDWDHYFISEAYLAARKSKDPSTQVGACIVGPDRETRSKGYNGPVRGFDDDDPAIWERPLKYQLTEHAERNAIFNCALIGTSCKGCTLYCTMHPCTDCARAIVQSGIREVVLHTENPGSTEFGWDADRLVAQRIFGSRVRVRWWSGTPLITEITCGGKLHRFCAPTS